MCSIRRGAVRHCVEEEREVVYIEPRGGKSSAELNKGGRMRADGMVKCSVEFRYSFFG